jgi:hypothetical protein
VRAIAWRVTVAARLQTGDGSGSESPGSTRRYSSVPTVAVEEVPGEMVWCRMVHPAGADHVAFPVLLTKISMMSPAACVGSVGVMVLPVPPGLVTTELNLVAAATFVGQGLVCYVVRWLRVIKQPINVGTYSVFDVV